MSAFTPASEVLLRHSDDFEQSRILFAGDLQDDLPAHLNAPPAVRTLSSFTTGRCLTARWATTFALASSPRPMTLPIAIR